MNSFVKNVFIIIATCTLTLILWSMMFVWGKPIIWDSLEDPLIDNWRASTFEDGRLIEEQLNKELNNVRDISTN